MGFESFTFLLAGRLENAANFRRAQQIVQSVGRQLWYDARRRVQENSDSDDRPLYWARVSMSRWIRQYQPMSFSLTSDQRNSLLDTLEQSSRGLDTTRYLPAHRNRKRILITGFDPFSLRSNDRRGNPSGAAVLSMDNKIITDEDGNEGIIQAAIFPVRFQDFDQSIVENWLTTVIDSSYPPDAVVTISMGASQDFEIERWAGRYRGARGGGPGFRDNENSAGGVTAGNYAEPANLANASEHLRTRLPVGQMTNYNAEPGDATVREDTSRPSGATVNNRTIRLGSGGGFLSNEIFYRSRLLLDQNTSIPVGHLHTPSLTPPGGSQTETSFDNQRNQIIDQTERIILSLLGSNS